MVSLSCAVLAIATIPRCSPEGLPSAIASVQGQGHLTQQAVRQKAKPVLAAPARCQAAGLPATSPGFGACDGWAWQQCRQA